MAAMNTNRPQVGEFFQLRPDARRGGRGHGVIFENKSALLTPPRIIVKPEEGGFPQLQEMPRLVHHPAEGALPEDLEGGFSGYWLVSQRLRRVMDAVDATAFAFADVDYRLADGSPGAAVFLCDVVRTLDALDEDASDVDIRIGDEYEAGKYYSLAGGSRLAFRHDVLEEAHVFRLPFHGGVFCDRVFKDAVVAAGIGNDGQSGGLWFHDVVNR